MFEGGIQPTDCTTAQEVRDLARRQYERIKQRPRVLPVLARPPDTKTVFTPPRGNFQPHRPYPKIVEIKQIKYISYDDRVALHKAYDERIALHKALHKASVEASKQKSMIDEMFRKPSHFTAREIIDVSNLVSGFGNGTMEGSSRIDKIIIWRMSSVWLVRQLTDLSTTQIGRYFNRDHSTIMHSIKCVNANPDKFWPKVKAIRDVLCGIDRDGK